MIRQFGPTEILFMLQAARWTVLLSLVAYAGGGALGLALATLRVSPWRAVRLFAACWIALFQSIPLLMLLFLVFFGLALVGEDQNPYVAVTIALSAYAGAYFGEIWRGAVQAIAPGQWEAARALGLRYLPIFRLIVLPQALRIAIPPTVGFMVQVVKNTSLASIIGFAELTQAAQFVNNLTFRPIPVYLVAAAIYFVLCFPLTWLSVRLERRLLGRLGGLAPG
ncbi:MAG: amino acid ABC transporter permease [Acetobacteraceae bacterium]|nr:amino acid ABC transporter permease [Acetobacteraceae bacterium]